MSRWFRGHTDLLLDVACGACLTSRRLAATDVGGVAMDLLRGWRGWEAKLCVRRFAAPSVSTKTVGISGGLYVLLNIG
jgi:hypothetical protein